MIHSKEHIENRLNELQQFSEGQYDNAEGSIIMDRLGIASAYLAESGKLKADADWHYMDALNSEIMNAIKNLMPDYLSASAQNQLVKSLAKNEFRLVTYADRVNRSLTHQIEAMRTQLSYLKEQMKL
ncbi:MAG TPA: hypothetical protein PLD32_13210 [Saprospiraceae bacterium]|nr:hypothetical protein [Saprospiraceae bacterium]HNC37519.1 hypothetical protein [Saprospiraceae bacterium]HNG70249.1 hypothetical protein [Saprospiraceae bacterium]